MMETFFFVKYIYILFTDSVQCVNFCEIYVHSFIYMYIILIVFIHVYHRLSLVCFK